MEKIKISNTNEVLYYHKFDSGLELYVLPNNNQKNFYITYSTKFGSIDTTFKTSNDSTYKTVPNGIAHYLEHLKFNLESGSAFDFFSKLGSSVNAFTSYDVTCFEVFSSTYFKENFNYLLDYVRTPYFTKELVNNERGIITEEIKMYKNNPNTELAYASYENVFVNDLRKNLISGEVEDIKEITLENIEDCYNTFYNPNNMFIIVTGNVNPYEAMGIVEEKERDYEYNNVEINRKKINEPIRVSNEYKEIKMNVETNKVSISYKIPKKNFKKYNLKDEMLYLYMEILFNILFGTTSDIQDKLLTSSVIQDGININKIYTKDYMVFSLTTDTDYPEMFIKMINDTINNISLNEEDFKRRIKVMKSSYILHFDNIELVNNNIQDNILLYGKFLNNEMHLYDKLSFNSLNDLCKLLKNKTCSTLVIKPKKNN